MQDIVLFLSVAAVFAFGFLVMKRLDAFLARNAKAIEGGAFHERTALRVAFSNPMAAGAVARSLESVCKGHSSIEVYLYTADPNILLDRLYSGRLDVVVIACEGIEAISPGYISADILVEPTAVMIEETSLQLCPLEAECVLQRLVWAKGACSGAADVFAAQVVQNSRRQAGNAYWKKV